MGCSRAMHSSSTETGSAVEAQRAVVGGASADRRSWGLVTVGCVVLLATVPGGCAETRRVPFEVELPDDFDGAAELVVRERDCAGAILHRSSTEPDGMESPPLAEGCYGFGVTIWDSACTRIAESCEVRCLPLDEGEPLSIVPAPITSIPCDGFCPLPVPELCEIPIVDCASRADECDMCVADGACVFCNGRCTEDLPGECGTRATTVADCRCFEATSCENCVGDNCGWCAGEAVCAAGSEAGPASVMACSGWIYPAGQEDFCRAVDGGMPDGGMPDGGMADCASHGTCTTCLDDGSCAWCPVTEECFPTSAGLPPGCADRLEPMDLMQCSDVCLEESASCEDCHNGGCGYCPNFGCFSDSVCADWIPVGQVCSGT